VVNKSVPHNNQTSTVDIKTRGVKILLGEPKKAVLKLALPMIVAMSAHTLYNLVDALWVSGLGASIFTQAEVPEVGAGALAAVGYTLPFFMMIISISTGLGIGGGSAISRRIGAKDKAGADSVAIHSIILTIVISIIFSIIFVTFTKDLFILIGAQESLGMAISYGRVIFFGSIVLFFTNVAFAILRGEGDAKRAMYAMMFGAVLNILLDPIFIFTFGFGVTGAAYATIISMFVTSLILIYWLFFRKDTYVSFTFHDFRFNKDILKDIFRVGLPASVQQLSMSVTMIAIIIIINFSGGGDDGIAIYNTGWRVVMVAILPLLGLATAVTSVTGAAFGEQSYEKLKIAYMYAIKFGLIIEILIGIVIFLLAPLIAVIFTTSPDAISIRFDLEMFLKITCFFYPGAAFGIASSAMFQGTGKGTYSLIATLFRTIVFTILFALVSTYIFEAGIIGIWWAIVLANLLGSLISFTWGTIYIHKLLKLPHRKEG
jgi:putative MATE family efflux protein